MNIRINVNSKSGLEFWESQPSSLLGCRKLPSSALKTETLGRFRMATPSFAASPLELRMIYSFPDKILNTLALIQHGAHWAAGSACKLPFKQKQTSEIVLKKPGEEERNQPPTHNSKPLINRISAFFWFFVLKMMRLHTHRSYPDCGIELGGSEA